MKSYRDLEIFNVSYDLAVRVHQFSTTLPKYELFEEGSQLRRSSKGVAACIVEGYGRRRYKAEFVKYLVYAHSSCDETIVHLNLLKDTHKLKSEELESLVSSYDELGKKINRFISYVDREWNRSPQLETRNP